ncbi:winged helix-turn-helix transcriptional regulator [Actinoplanes philippinensis]|uniref:winged helix-turn-helix transcriptional regulator n=1 Tax=Actinoplanes philippinensis TaxID=35752 RepID=UPI0033FD3B68
MTVVDEQHASCVRRDAALSRAFEFLGRRWNAAVLGKLRGEPVGFRDLSRSISGISDSVLSNRLSSLATAGLIIRIVDEGPPVSVSYGLTPAGHALMPALDRIADWADEHIP